ncbi:MAG: hypothetical protein QXJ03_04805 [Desulfurococcus sp.]
MSKRSKTLEKTVVLSSPPLTKTKLEALSYVYRAYGEILVEALEYMLKNNTVSWTKAKKNLYKAFREKYPELPSHYIHEAIRDASARLKSFLKLKKKGLAKTDRPVVKKWSIGCDNQLWKLTRQGASIATHRGWINVPMNFHKLFWRYYNSGWIPRSSARWRITGNRLYLYIVFSKEVEVKNISEVWNIYGIDINENNITVYDHGRGRAVTIVTNFSKVVLGYAHRRAGIQEKWSSLYGVNENRRLKAALRKLRERNTKKDLRYKVVKAVVEMVKDGVVVLEKLPSATVSFFISVRIG